MIRAPLSWRLFRRDLASGELRVLLAALILAVCAVGTVAFVTDRAGRALALEANRLLGGDAVLRADRPLDPAFAARAAELGLQQTETRGFNGMIGSEGGFRLAELRALGEGFPLRGGFRLVAEAAPDGVPAAGIPAPGTAWLSRSGAEALQVQVGDSLQVGTQQLRLAALVQAEPDSVLDFFNAAPRLFFNLADLPATGLEQEGSRIAYRLVLAGEAGAVERFSAWTATRLGRGMRLETMADARPEIRSALDRAERFLGLSALIAVVLAAVAVAMAARRHSARHLDGVAVMRCLGASQAQIVRLHLLGLVWLGLIGSAVGVIAAWGIQYGLGLWLQDALGVSVPAAGIVPALQGLSVGFAVLAGFAAPPVLALRNTPTLRVIRRDLDTPGAAAWASALAGLLALMALLTWQAGSLQLGALVLGGLAAALLALALLGLGLVALLRRVRARLKGPWRYGLANVSRRAGTSVAQIAALGLGLMAILLLTLVRTDLVARWQAALPPDAPNRFLINIQADQLDAVQAFLRENGLEGVDLYPMVRGRFVEHNGRAVNLDDYAGDRARRLAEREFNLSFGPADRADNRRLRGEYWPAAGRGRSEVSVEAGIAERLGWALGDRIAFDIAGRRFEAEITSLRHVDWESFQPNFFVLAAPGSLDGFPASWISSLHLPPDKVPALNALIARFPNVSAIDIEAVLAQVRGTADQVATAVEYVFYFTLVAGLLVLFAAISASRDERLLEGGVMRVLGANTRQLRLAQLSEFAALGLLAGLTAALGATLLSGSIAVRVFDLPWTPDWRLMGAGAVAGILLVSVFGLLATRRVASAPPADTLRALQGG